MKYNSVRFISATTPSVAGLRPWQLLSAGAFVLNVVTVSIPGRIDGQVQRRMQEKMLAKKNDSEPPPEPDGKYISLLTPAGWAFAIWGVIYTAELGFTLYQALSINAEAAMLARVSSWWAGVCVFQALWCMTFREWSHTTRHFWLSASLLSVEALVFAGAHAELRQAVQGAAGMSLFTYLLAHVPLSLHFGWITCAAVVNMNSVAAFMLDVPSQLAFAFASVFGAAGLGAYVTLATGDPLYAMVIDWALTAVKSDGAKRAEGKISETSRQALMKAASWGAKIARGAVVLTGLKHLSSWIQHGSFPFWGS